MIGKVQPIKSVFARPSGPSLALDKKHCGKAETKKESRKENHKNEKKGKKKRNLSRKIQKERQK